MSDKSFGDHMNRNIVKNPLLSTAVTGLSIEDLTHKAVLLPVAQSQELITRQDQQIGLQNVTPADHATGNTTAPQHSFSPLQPPPKDPSSAQPKSSSQPKDDFDVNEYFARLQGTRYVSAPLNTSLKEDLKEDNLEEINLNEPEKEKAEEAQQSITADIAQNFSQLPTVLPQVASAVFSSFSNYLSYKREVPDERPEVRSQEIVEDVGVPLMGMDEPAVPREVAPPPKEMAVGGTSNFRITTKKKAYAQIPGLSSHIPPQSIGSTAQNVQPPPTMAPPSFFTPDDNFNAPPVEIKHDTYFTPENKFNAPPVDIKQDNKERTHVEVVQKEYNIFNPTETWKDDTVTQSNNDNFNTFAKANENMERNTETIHMYETLNTKATENMERKETIQMYAQETANISNPVQGNAAIIPPPPMFSNLPRKDSSPSVGKSVLPPSVARRIGANHPIIKSQTMQAPAFPSDGIFIPTMSDVAQNLNIPTNVSQNPNIIANVPEKSKTDASSQDLPTQNLPSAFVQFKSTYSTITSMHSPNTHQMMTSESHDRAYSHSQPALSPDARVISPPTAVRSDVAQSPISPPSFFNPGDLTESLSSVNATKGTSIESAVASNTANISQMSATSPPTFFNPSPSSEKLSTGSAQQSLSSTMEQMPPPTFFNPAALQPTNQKIDAKPILTPPTQNIGQYIDQTPTESKPVPEPPKIAASNFRMTKKRPQYYSGPIEGVGSISNNVKPVIPGSETQVFQGALFTPDTKAVEQPVLSEQGSVPFDISQQASVPFDIAQPEQLTSSYTAFAINSQINNQAQSYVQPEYNTAFDLSRPSTENYDQSYESKPEAKGFGIIGSLKSKLSALDINKIHNSVTTFFDPAYNDTKKEQADAPQGFNQTNAGFGYSNQDSNLEIFVPNVQNQPYNQSYSSDNQYQNVYSFSQKPQDNNTSYYKDNYGTGPGQSFRHNLVEHYHSTFPQGHPSNTGRNQVEAIGNAPSSQGLLNVHVLHSNSDVTSSRDGSNLNPALMTAFQETTAPEDDDKNDQEISLEKMENEVANLTSTPVVDSTFSTYNLFSNPNNDAPPPIKPAFDNVNKSNIFPAPLNKSDIFPGPIIKSDIPLPKLEPSSALSFFDNPPTNIGILPDIKKEQPAQIIPSTIENFDLTPDLSVDIFNPVHSEIKSSSDLFGPPKNEDFVQSPFGCAFIKKDNVTEKDTVKSDDVNKCIDLMAKQEIKNDIPTSAVPLYDLSSILAERAREMSDLEESIENITLKEVGENMKTRLDSNSVGFIENLYPTRPFNSTNEDNEGISELNMCETCREIDKPENSNVEDLTIKLIENITSPIQLSNPVVAPLTEAVAPNEAAKDFDAQQCAEISHITEETIETIQVQSATELLDDIEGISKTTTRNYGWSTEDAYISPEALVDHSYTFQIDTNAIGFFGNNPMFFDDIPNNASDEIKAEFKSSQEDSPPVVLQRQMSIPSAPPAEDEDSKSDETGVLDVNSIEQDANKDFPIYEEFVIEPSETDDDKIEYRERERVSDDPVPDVDSFTNRVERFKQEVKMEEVDKLDDGSEGKPVLNIAAATSPAITIASYFDTGNYAVETHYRNSLTSPSSIPYPMSSPDNSFSIPPGFEGEYKRKLSAMVADVDKDKDGDTNANIPFIPDTSTQTRPVITTTYNAATLSSPVTVSSSIDANRNEKPTETKLPEFSSVFGRTHEAGDSLSSSLFGNVEDKKETTEILSAPIEKESQKPLQDPISFFSAGQDVENETNNEFNRLASYFQTPAKTDHGKSFFELSQSQNHYRHATDSDKANSNQIAQNSKAVRDFFDVNQNPNVSSEMQNIPTDVYVANVQLMRDLTSVQNLAFPKDQNVRTVNYFTVEYDSEDINAFKTDTHEPFKELKDLEPTKVEENDSDEIDDENAVKAISKCMHCLNLDSRNVVVLNKVELDSVKFKYKTAMDSDNSEGSYAGRKDESPKEEQRREVAVNFGPLDEENEGVALASENRTTTEYTPVRHHWFYRVDFEGKSIWRGFSASDSRALEEAFHSPNLTEDTLVATDGGRFDVNVMGRLRIAVYWADKPTNVRRCSWFYKGATDARYVPYTEPVAEKLEEEYRHGVTTGEWHRRLALPHNESVVMHGPGVMVHFPQPATDAFGTAPQSTMRPRVVRRGCDETEIEDPEPSSIDHLLLLCHGVGSACDMRFRSLEEVVDDFRATSLQLLQSHYRNAYDKGVVNRVEVLPISWHTTLHSGETGVDKRLAAITLDSIPKLRNFTNDTVLDVLFYTSPVFCQTIINTVCAELNRIYELFMKRNPGFKGEVSVGGHSLGSVIMYDLLCHQAKEGVAGSPNKIFVSGRAGTGQTMVQYPPLSFTPAAMYALGSPIAMFECIRGVKSLGTDFALPTCKNFFNIFHPYDPIAYRIEPLINAQLGAVKPFLIPHHKGRKRMHLELRDTMARVGADLKAKLLESLKATWSSMWKQQPPPNDEQLEKVVEEEMEKEQLCDEAKDEAQNDLEYGEALGRLNGGRRVDYVLQEAPFEMINEYLFAMSSHVCYWESEDTMLLILREIYDALGVQPDCTVPMRTMTVQRTRTLRPEENETIVMNASEHPSTSRGGT